MPAEMDDFEALFQGLRKSFMGGGGAYFVVFGLEAERFGGGGFEG